MPYESLYQRYRDQDHRTVFEHFPYNGEAGVPELLIEIKYSITPKITKGFHITKTDLQTKRNYIICLVEKAYPISDDTTVCGLKDIPGLFPS
jgi:hypothetical protein